MAAAVSLAERGVRVTVFESTAVPGGRARRVDSQGQVLDNGQHILIGAYRTLYQLMRTVGVAASAVLRIPLEVRYPGSFHFRRGALGLAGALVTARGIPFAERLRAARFIARLRRTRFRLAADTSVSELLAQYGQGGHIGHFLWRPLCVSALNTPPELASASVFLAVLRDTLGATAAASDLVLPRVDLSRLFPEPAVQFVRAHGGEVRLQSPVKDLGAHLVRAGARGNPAGRVRARGNDRTDLVVRQDETRLGIVGRGGEDDTEDVAAGVDQRAAGVAAAYEPTNGVDVAGHGLVVVDVRATDLADVAHAGRLGVVRPVEREAEHDRVVVG